MNSTQLTGRLLSISFALFTVGGCQHSAQTLQPTTAPAAALTAASLQKAPTLIDLTGGDLGIGGGFLIGAAPGKIAAHQRADAVAAAQRAEQAPARLQQVREAKTADLNKDGYVTLDEVLAMARAGLSAEEISARLKATGYVFQTTPEQQRYLTDRGVTPAVISTLQSLNGSAVALKEH
ncbi:MAG TPA: hypothetical protein VFE47_16885 [Tepidisphaeraceae bacterium]|jgi:hypothetical protein|nr:hypothetical protein [Tepidisphaeraceae bacterium]